MAFNIPLLPSIPDDLTIINTLTVGGNTTLGGNLTVAGDLDVTGALDFTGDVEITGDLDVTGLLTLDPAGAYGVGTGLAFGGGSYIRESAAGVLDYSATTHAFTGDLAVSGTLSSDGQILAQKPVSGATAWFYRAELNNDSLRGGLYSSTNDDLWVRLYGAGGVETVRINSSGDSFFSGGKVTITGVPTAASLAGASLSVNPATAPANGWLLSAGVGGTSVFSVDEDGDVVAAGGGSFGGSSSVDAYAPSFNVLTLSNSYNTGSKLGCGLLLNTDDGSAMENGEGLGLVIFGGASDAANTIQYVVKIAAIATEAWGPTAEGAELQISTTANGATSRSLAMTINNAQGMDLVGNATIGGTLSVTGDFLGSAIAVTTLPTSSILTGAVYRLTAADTTAKAPPGHYVYDGTAWQCISCTAAYAWGNLGATPALTLISGALYTWAVSEAVTSATITVSRPGIPAAFVGSNSGGDNFLVAAITATSRTLKSVGWDTAIVDTKGCSGTILDDGTNVVITAAAFDA